MIIIKKFADAQEVIGLKNSIADQTTPWINGFHRPNGTYAKINEKNITLVNVENDFSLRGSNPSIYFYGRVISIFKKHVLIGFIGPSFLLTVFTLLVLMCPFEYVYIRFIALMFWLIVYFTNMKRIKFLEQFF